MSAAITPIAQALFESLYPLVRAAEDPAYRTHLLRQLGWDEDAAAELLVLGPQIADWWKRGLEQQADLAKAIAAKDAEAQFVCAMLLLEIAFESATPSSRKRENRRTGPLQPGVRDALWNDLALALPGYLVLRWMRISQPILYWLLRITDVVRARDRRCEPARARRRRRSAPSPGTAGCAARRARGLPQGPLRLGIRCRRLSHIRTVTTRVRRRRCGTAGCCRSCNDCSRISESSPGWTPYASAMSATASPSRPAARHSPGARQLGVPLLHGPVGGKGPFAELGIDLVPLPGTRGPDIVDGLYLTNFATAAKATTYDLGSGWSLQAGAGAVVSDAVAVRLLPGQVRLGRRPAQRQVRDRCNGTTGSAMGAVRLEHRHAARASRRRDRPGGGAGGKRCRSSPLGLRRARGTAARPACSCSRRAKATASCGNCSATARLEVGLRPRVRLVEPYRAFAGRRSRRLRHVADAAAARPGDTRRGPPVPDRRSRTAEPARRADGAGAASARSSARSRRSASSSRIGWGAGADEGPDVRRALDRRGLQAADGHRPRHREPGRDRGRLSRIRPRARRVRRHRDAGHRPALADRGRAARREAARSTRLVAVAVDLRRVHAGAARLRLHAERCRRPGRHRPHDRRRARCSDSCSPARSTR